MKVLGAFTAVFLCIVGISTATADTISVLEAISVVGAVDDTDNNGSLVIPALANGDIDNSLFAAPGGPLGPTNGSSYQYGIRERSNTTQQDRTFYSFLAFDVSSLNAAEVADPMFSAIFTVDYQGHLNSVNNGADYALGTPNAAWDSTTNVPTTALGEAATAIPNSLLITNGAANPDPQPGLSADITTLVQGWFDGSIANYGLTFIEVDEAMANVGAGTATSQSGYFSNASIVTTVPEPSSLTMLGLMMTVGLVLRRRR